MWSSSLAVPFLGVRLSREPATRSSRALRALRDGRASTRPRVGRPQRHTSRACGRWFADASRPAPACRALGVRWRRGSGCRDGSSGATQPLHHTRSACIVPGHGGAGARAGGSSPPPGTPCHDRPVRARPTRRCPGRASRWRPISRAAPGPRRAGSRSRASPDSASSAPGLRRQPALRRAARRRRRTVRFRCSPRSASSLSGRRCRLL